MGIIRHEWLLPRSTSQECSLVEMGQIQQSARPTKLEVNLHIGSLTTWCILKLNDKTGNSTPWACSINTQRSVTSPPRYFCFFKDYWNSSSHIWSPRVTCEVQWPTVTRLQFNQVRVSINIICILHVEQRCLLICILCCCFA